MLLLAATFGSNRSLTAQTSARPLHARHFSCRVPSGAAGADAPNLLNASAVSSGWEDLGGLKSEVATRGVEVA